MFTLKGYCKTCKHTTYLLWFVGGIGNDYKIKRQCVFCEEICEFLVDKSAVKYLFDLHLDEFESLIIKGIREFYALVRRCYHCQRKSAILILDQQIVAGKIHVDGFCTDCRQKQSFVITQELYKKQLHTIKITGV